MEEKPKSIVELKQEIMIALTKNNLVTNDKLIEGITAFSFAQNIAVYLYHRYFNNLPIENKECCGTIEIPFPNNATQLPPSPLALDRVTMKPNPAYDLAPSHVEDKKVVGDEGMDRTISVRLDNGAILPQYGSEHSSGFDLVANFHNIPVYANYTINFQKSPDLDYWVVAEGEDYYIAILPGHSAPIPTGLYVEIPPNHEIQIRPRSGMAIKRGLTVINSPGTIDADYRGEIVVLLHNSSIYPQIIKNGMKIAQGVVCPVFKANWLIKDILSDTERGVNGFGHTDKKS